MYARIAACDQPALMPERPRVRNYEKIIASLIDELVTSRA